MSNFCKYCNKPLTGRSDKRFCDSQCRITYHNSHKNNKEVFIRVINKKLRKNRSILKFASPRGKTTVEKSFLLRLGFNFSFYTNHFISKSGNTYTLCYDYGYMEIDNDKVLIINRQPFMD